jgi:CRISPR system Cascade subunit CasD
VVGLLCAALGRSRDAPIDDLAALRMGVRVDREGMLLRDYHTAQNVRKSGGGTKSTELSERFYLADAVFLVGMEGEPAVLQMLDQALRTPIWPLFLGRKAFVPGVPPTLPEGYRAGETLEQALERWPRLVPASRVAMLRYVIELRTTASEEYAATRLETRQDQPLSFQRDQRQYTIRRVMVRTVILS